MDGMDDSNCCTAGLLLALMMDRCLFVEFPFFNKFFDHELDFSWKRHAKRLLAHGHNATEPKNIPERIPFGYVTIADVWMFKNMTAYFDKHYGIEMWKDLDWSAALLVNNPHHKVGDKGAVSNSCNEFQMYLDPRVQRYQNLGAVGSITRPHSIWRLSLWYRENIMTLRNSAVKAGLLWAATFQQGSMQRHVKSAPVLGESAEQAVSEKSWEDKCWVCVVCRISSRHISRRGTSLRRWPILSCASNPSMTRRSRSSSTRTSSSSTSACRCACLTLCLNWICAALNVPCCTR